MIQEQDPESLLKIKNGKQCVPNRGHKKGEAFDRLIEIGRRIIANKTKLALE